MHYETIGEPSQPPLVFRGFPCPTRRCRLVSNTTPLRHINAWGLLV
jgi:hypothetical protein